MGFFGHLEMWWQLRLWNSCKEKALKSGDTWGCTTDGLIAERIFMYYVPGIITNNTAAAAVTIFDKAAKELFDKDCATFVVKERFADQKNIPLPMQELRGQQKVFQLKGQPGNAKVPPIYSVNRIISNTTSSATPSLAPLTPSMAKTITPTSEQHRRQKDRCSSPPRTPSAKPKGFTARMPTKKPTRKGW